MESKGFKGGWNGLGKAEMKIQVQSWHVPKQKEKPPQNPPHSPPDGKFSCGCSNKHMGLMFHVEETRAQAEHSAAL